MPDRDVVFFAVLLSRVENEKANTKVTDKKPDFPVPMVEEEAVEQAITECIKEDILAEFLIKNRAEVTSMSIFEYDREEEEKKLRKAEFEAGVEEGVKRGKVEGKREGIIEGKREGIKQGRFEYLSQLVCRKAEKGMSAKEIAEDLGEDEEMIRDIMGKME